MTRTVLHTQSLSLKMQKLTVYEINLFQILSLIFKCKYITVPLAFHNLYTVKPLRKHSFRTDNLPSILLKRTTFRQFFISFRDPYLWNKIPTKKSFICNLESYPLFKKRLKEYFLNDAIQSYHDLFQVN